MSRRIRRLAAAALIAAGLASAAPLSAPAALAGVTWGAKPNAVQHAVVADTWTKHTAPRDTWV